MFLAYGDIFLSEGIEKGIKYNQDQSSIMLPLELNFRHSAVVLRVTLKSIMLKFSSIMYLTLAMGEGGEGKGLHALRKCQVSQH